MRSFITHAVALGATICLAPSCGSGSGSSSGPAPAPGDSGTDVPLPVVGESFAGLPDTGQTSCYDIGNEIDCNDDGCPSQDGFNDSGCPPEGRFADNGDGTVTDTCTGLVWQQGTADVNGDGRGNTFDALDWCSALAYCDGLDLAGHDDWRLPSITELESIADYGGGASGVAFSGASSGRYWSSTSWAGGPASAWNMGLPAGGSSHHDDKAEPFLVRAVRSGLAGDEAADAPDTGQETCYDAAGNAIDCGSAACPGQDGSCSTDCPPRGRFVDNGDGTVTDTCTSLMWQQDVGNTQTDRLTWCEALAYCDGLGLAGHGDWRLPNIRELLSIVDYGRSQPSIDPVFRTPAGRNVRPLYWSSTTRPANFQHALLGDFETGGSLADGKFDCEACGGAIVHFVRAVRDAR